MLAVLVLVSVLGLPLGFTMLSGLNVLAPLGYVTTALILGRFWVKAPTPRARIGAFFAGFGVLRLVAIVPGLGFLVWFGACLYGIGAVSMAAWYGGHEPRPRDVESVEDAAPPAPPPDAAPGGPGRRGSRRGRDRGVIGLGAWSVRCSGSSPRSATTASPTTSARSRAGSSSAGSATSLIRRTPSSCTRLERLEGDSDPSEMLAVCAVECPKCGSKGTLVLTFGPESTREDDDDVMELLDDARRPGA